MISVIRSIIEKKRIFATRAIAIALFAVLCISSFTFAFANDEDSERPVSDLPDNAVISVTVNGRTKVEIRPVGSAPAVNPAVIEVVNKGEIVIPFVSSGDVSYEVRQVGDDSNIIYDKTVWLVRLYVRKDANGEKRGVIINRKDHNQKVDAIAFVNKGADREYDPVIGDPPISKKVEGSPKTPGTFTFIFEAYSNDAGYEIKKMPMPTGSRDGVKELTVTGGGEYEFGNILFTKPGTYTYIASEKNNSEKGYKYDRIRFTVSYYVSENNGKLSLVRKISDADGNQYNTCTFVNRYSEDGNPPSILTGDPSDPVTWTVVLAIASLAMFIIKRRTSGKQTADASDARRE